MQTSYRFPTWLAALLVLLAIPAAYYGIAGGFAFLYWLRDAPTWIACLFALLCSAGICRKDCH